jgi:hypothetical protein
VFARSAGADERGLVTLEWAAIVAAITVAAFAIAVFVMGTLDTVASEVDTSFGSLMPPP